MKGGKMFTLTLFIAYDTDGRKGTRVEGDYI